MTGRFKKPNNPIYNKKKSVLIQVKSEILE